MRGETGRAREGESERVRGETEGAREGESERRDREDRERD